MTSIKDTIEKMTSQLIPFSESARLDAELLVGHVLGKPRPELFIHSEATLSTKQLQVLKALLERRMSQEPIAYIVGHKEFWTLDLTVNRDVLIPRPETEMLVEWALTYLPALRKLSVADVGTGSGAIALALALERPQWQIDATENEATALKVAQQNAQKYGVKNVNFYMGEWCHALPHKNYQAILGNPPYIKEGDEHLFKLTRFEPRSALVGGNDGLAAIRKIVMDARRYLIVGGWLVLEHGYDQHDAIIQLVEEFGYQEIKDHHDLANLPRMIVCRK